MRAQINTSEKLMRKSNESIPHRTSQNRIFSFSLLSRNNSLSLSSSRSLKKERTTKTKALKAANNTLSLFLPYFFMFLYTNTYRGKILFYCVCFSSNESKKTLNTQALKSRSPKTCLTHSQNFPHNNKTENTQHGGK